MGDIHCVGEHGQPIFDKAFIKQDASFGIAQQPRQRTK
jgi:hypothetical protein